jgi:thioredoxin-like negative regulator of GroEL
MVTVNDNDRVALGQLLQLAINWGWRGEQEQLLWRIADRSSETWALFSLMDLYFRDGRTEELRRVADYLLARSPQTALLKNNSALLSLLLARDFKTGTRLAREAYDAEPANPNFACTLAFALHRAGHTADALQLMKTLPEEALRRPNTAAYLSLLLRKTGDVAQADRYAALASPESLLPEERAMLR